MRAVELGMSIQSHIQAQMVCVMPVAQLDMTQTDCESTLCIDSLRQPHLPMKVSYIAIHLAEMMGDEKESEEG